MSTCSRCGGGETVIGRPAPGLGLEPTDCPQCVLSLPDRFRRRIREVRPRQRTDGVKAINKGLRDAGYEP